MLPYRRQELGKGKSTEVVLVNGKYISSSKRWLKRRSFSKVSLEANKFGERKTEIFFVHQNIEK